MGGFLMMKHKRIFVVPHSHWDREWYFTIEDSNVLLIENLDYLIDVLERDKQFHAYVFDAQVSVVEEYLNIRPEQRERLEKLITEKRIFIGPWYTQSDSLLVNKESLIRNLLYGTRIANKMGHSMKIGYLPDIFGQNAYLPSIFRGFDIEYSILQRGIYTDQLKNNLNFVWKSPDGKTVKANNIFLGYGPGKFLSADDQYFKNRLLPMIEKLAEMNRNSNEILLPAGGDQVLVRKELPQVVVQLNQKDPKYEYVLSDYETFMEQTWAEESKFQNVIEGELIASQQSRIHNTIRSQRYDIKQLNYLVENKILYVLEPLAVIGHKLGLKYPQAWLDKVWKLLFDVHAHDSIGGCNSDDTNNNILARLNQVSRIADGLLNIIKKQITWAVSQQLGKENILVIFNTLPKSYSGSVESVLFTKKPLFSLYSLDGLAIPFDIVEQRQIPGGKKIVVTAQGEQEIELPGYFRTAINIQAENIPAMGYTTYSVLEEGTEVYRLTRVTDTTIANEQYRLSFDKGYLNLHNLQTGQTLENFLCFEDVADAGDSYDYSPLRDDQPILLREAKLIDVIKGKFVQKMIVSYRCTLPNDLTERQNGKCTKNFEILTTFELRQREPLLRVSHEINNTVCDHRLRAIFKTPVQNITHSYADQAFGIVSRPVKNPYLQNWREQKFAEAPIPIYPLENFVAIREKNATFAVITRGIKEYEVLTATDELAITLYRSVGVLGRDDLLWRPGRASGINDKVVYTPDAQLQKTLNFEYAIYMSDTAFKPQDLFYLTDIYTARHTTYQLQHLNTFEDRLERFDIPKPIAQLPASYSLFKIDNDSIFMSVCKRAYEDEGTIVRLFNPTERPQKITLETNGYAKMMLTNLYESEQEQTTGTVEIPPKGYATIKMI
jgi:alpha-mannosidase